MAPTFDHSKIIHFEFDGVVLAGPGASDTNRCVTSIDWPETMEEHEKTVLGDTATATQPGLEVSPEITVNGNLNAAAITNLRNKKGLPGKTAIYGPIGNAVGAPRYRTQDCFLRDFRVTGQVKSIQTFTAVIRVGSGGTPLEAFP